MNKNNREKKLPNFCISLPNFTKRQEKWFYFFSSVVIVLLIGLIGFLMYITANPDVFPSKEKSKATEIYETSKKEYTTWSRKEYSGGVYEPTELITTTSPNTTAWYGEEIEASPPTEITTRPVTTTRPHILTTETGRETTTSVPSTKPASEVSTTEISSTSTVQEENTTGNVLLE